MLPVTKASAMLAVYSITSRHSTQGPGTIGTLSLMPVTVSMHVTAIAAVRNPTAMAPRHPTFRCA